MQSPYFLISISVSELFGFRARTINICNTAQLTYSKVEMTLNQYASDEPHNPLILHMHSYRSLTRYTQAQQQHSGRSAAHAGAQTENAPCAQTTEPYRHAQAVRIRLDTRAHIYFCLFTSRASVGTRLSTFRQTH